VKKLLGFIFGFIIIITAVLYHTLNLEGTPFSPDSLPTSYTLSVLPLDSRPPCTSFVAELGTLAGIKVDLPPKEMLDKYEHPAKISQLEDWLANDFSSTKGALISTDMLSFGGLLHNRTHSLSDDQRKDVLSYLEWLRKSNPQKDFYVFSVIPRLLVSDQVVPDSWYQWHLMQWTIDMDKKLQGKPFDAKQYKELQDEIPMSLKWKYIELYNQNALFNKDIIDLSQTANFTGLVIGQDDTMPYGLPNNNRLAALDAFGNLPPRTGYGVTQGADELGSMAVAEVFLKEHSYRPKIFLTYSTPETKDLILHFVPETLEQIALNKIRLLNGKVVDSLDKADFVLFIHCGDKGDSSFSKIAKQINSYMKVKPVALVDLSKNYDYRECLLPSLLASSVPLSHLVSYAGWNTASNSIGSAIAQSSIVTLQAKTLPPELLPSLYARNLTYNCQRFLDDWAYEQNTRYKIKDLKELNGVDSEHTAPYTDLVERYIARELHIYKNILLYANLRRFPFYQNGKDAYYLKDFSYEVRLPWERIFEISLSIQPKFIKKAI
jgi:hypothetical protein